MSAPTKPHACKPGESQACGGCHGKGYRSRAGGAPCLSCDGTGLVPYVALPPKDATEGKKDDAAKPDYLHHLSPLLPSAPLAQVVKVLEFGAERYGADNWRKVEKVRYVKAILRHTVAAIRGEKTDPDTGASHWAHAACCALFLIELDVAPDQPQRIPYTFTDDERKVMHWVNGLLTTLEVGPAPGTDRAAICENLARMGWVKRAHTPGNYYPTEAGRDWCKANPL